MADGFLGRWSRRKLDVAQGKPVEAEPPASVPAAAPTAPAARAMDPVVPAAEPAVSPPPPPTLEDVAALTTQSDFSRFSAPDVPPEVRNAAMKKLFSDPHFHVMDGLDVYIDDYSRPDPLPESMLRSLASSEFLGLFREEKREDGGESGVNPVESDPAGQYGAQSSPAVPDSPPSDADPDLRLQQDHAPGPQGPGPGDR